SRCYLPQSLWDVMGDQLLDVTGSLSIGDVRDFSNFSSAVIDKRSFDKQAGLFSRIRSGTEAAILVGGSTDDSRGWYVRPTVIKSDNPKHEIFCDEYFGPILSVYVYPDNEYEEVLDLVDGSAPYGLTGSIFGTDRQAIELAQTRLRFTAGNFYINDKPTGAVVGQQPFGGARASGTNDKAGSLWNLGRWASPRAIKETLMPPTDHRYPHMG
ncbi:MAG: aldehyde dehydrogenase family protein, partial [Microlunatus sp.]|nr:aldehyde dehydrogenase family protein [Microlunatus sp.]